MHACGFSKHGTWIWRDWAHSWASFNLVLYSHILVHHEAFFFVDDRIFIVIFSCKILNLEQDGWGGNFMVVIHATFVNM
jgi:hypothetical protein